MKSRDRLLTQVGIAGLAMIILAILFGSESTSKTRPLRHAPVDDGTARRITTLFAGIPQQGAELGDPGAPVTLQFFADLECEEARQFVIGALPFLVRRWVRGGDLRIVYRANREETVEREIFARQQIAVLAAGAQGKAWDYLDFFYHEQGPEFSRYATEHFLRAIADEVPSLDPVAWTGDRRDTGLKHRLREDLSLAREHRIGFTPAFLVGPTNGVPKRVWNYSLTESGAFDEAIEMVLAEADA